MADYYTKLNPTLTYRKINDITARDAIALVKKKLFKIWSNHWHELILLKPTQYAQIHLELPKQTWYSNANVPKKMVTTINRLKFGHGCFPAHLFKIHVFPDPYCSCDRTLVADLNHIFFACQNYPQEIHQFIVNLCNEGVALPTNVVTLLSLNELKVFKVIYNFLTNINLNI